MAITSSASGIGRIESILAEEAEDLLGHECTTIARDRLHLPGPDFVDRVVKDSDRPVPVLRSLQSIFSHGRLGGTGYVSILPVDQGIEHSAGASFAKNPDYFDPAGIVKLAIEGGCNAVASTLGVLGAVRAQVRAPHPVHRQAQPQRVPELSERLRPDHVRARSSRRASMGAVAVGATIYFGSEESKRQIVEVSEAFAARPRARHGDDPLVLPAQLGLQPARRTAGPTTTPPPTSTGQANHLGVTIEADIIKQKLPEVAAPGFTDLNFGKTDKRVYSELMTPHPIDMTRYQLANCYMGRAGPDQLGRRVGRQRPAGRRQDRRDQQARRRHRA